MECSVRRHLCAIAICLVLIGAQPAAPSQARAGWKTLVDGLEIIRIQSHQTSVVGDSSITVLRIDPRLFELEAIGIAQTHESAGHTAREWSQHYKYVAAINAGMFQSDGKTHLGYLRSHDHVYNNRVNNYQSVMAFDPRPGKNVAAFRIFDLELSKNLQPIVEDYASVVQNLRLIKRPGLNQWGKQSRAWSEAALGEDRDGRVLFIYSRSPFSMHDLNQELLAADIGLVAAQHMEGGPEAQLYIHAGTMESEMFGSYETSFKENDQNSAAWPVPNVIGVRSRTSQH